MVTIIVDASWCPSHKVAGYACWVRDDRHGKGLDYSGKFSYADTSGTAEIMAIANSLWAAFSHNRVRRNETVLVQTDCLQAIRTLTENILTKNNREEEARNYIKSLVVRYGIKIQYRHVKGHTGKNASRFSSQAICDKKARSQMRKARGLKVLKQIKKELHYE